MKSPISLGNAQVVVFVDQLLHEVAGILQRLEVLGRVHSGLTDELNGGSLEGNAYDDHLHDVFHDQNGHEVALLLACDDQAFRLQAGERLAQGRAIDIQSLGPFGFAQSHSFGYLL
jgi:hypothetical protein